MQIGTVWRIVIPQLKVTISFITLQSWNPVPVIETKNHSGWQWSWEVLSPTFCSKQSQQWIQSKLFRDLPTANPCWLVWITSFFSVHPEVAFKQTCLMIFLGNRLKFTVLCLFLLLSMVRLLFFSHQEPPCSNVCGHSKMKYPWSISFISQNLMGQDA